MSTSRWTAWTRASLQSTDPEVRMREARARFDEAPTPTTVTNNRGIETVVERDPAVRAPTTRPTSSRITARRPAATRPRRTRKRMKNAAVPASRITSTANVSNAGGLVMPVIIKLDLGWRSG
jgi:hypothetical protein